MTQVSGETVKKEVEALSDTALALVSSGLETLRDECPKTAKAYEWTMLFAIVLETARSETTRRRINAS